MIPSFDESLFIEEDNLCVYCRRVHDHFYLDEGETLGQTLLLFCPDCAGVTVRERLGVYRLPNRKDRIWIKDYPNLDELRQYQEDLWRELRMWG